MKSGWSEQSLAFLEKLLNTASPSGHEMEAAEAFAAYMEPACDDVSVDVMGNVTATLNPEADFKIMMAAHCDEIGMRIIHISNEGMLYFQLIGDVDKRYLAGRRVEILSGDGDRVAGVVGVSKPIHLLSENERKTDEISDFWIDIGTTSKKEAMTRVNVGDPAVWEGRFRWMNGNLLTGGGLDDKIGVFILAETMRRLARGRLDVAVYAVATTQEELGFRGVAPRANVIKPNLGVAVDVGFATDVPSMRKEEYGDLRLGGGPALTRNADNNERLIRIMRETAERNNVKTQWNAAFWSTSKTDAERVQLSGEGVAVGTVHIPCRYMHSPVETCHARDVADAIELLTLFIESFDDQSKKLFV